MASPFRVFRKYQKTLLVVAGVVLMFVFVIGDSLVGYLSGSRRGAANGNQEAHVTAVSWDNGSLTNQELANLVAKRRMVNSFLQSVEYQGLQSSVAAGVEPRELRVQSLLGQPSEQAVVATKLYADTASEAGMKVSDDAIVRYLDDLGRQRVSREDMRAMLSRAGGGGVPAAFIMDALREEMLAHSYLASHQFSFVTVTPQQGFEDWLRVNDRITVEAAAVPVESFVVDVPEPTEAELTAFFEQHKQREPQPDLIGQMEFPSAIPGFAIPRKIDVQFIEANYDQFVTNVENQITEEEIAKFYEDNKDPLFIKADTNLFNDAPETTTPNNQAEENTTGATAPPSGDAMPADAPASGADTTPPPAAETTPDSTPATQENTPANGSNTTPPTGTSTPPAEGTATPPTGNQSQSDGARNGLFRLTAFAQEQPTQPSETGSAAAPPATTQSPPAADETTAPVTTTDGAASNTAPEATATPPATSTAAPGAASTDAAAPATTSTPPAAEKPKEFQPLADVKDEIRSRLARDRVNEQLTTLMGELQSQVNGEFTSYYGARLSAEAETQSLPDPPAALKDLAPLAAKHNLQHGTTGAMSWLEMRKTPVGASGDVESGNELYRILFATQELDTFQPVSTQDVDGNRFVAIKVSDTPGRVPTLKEVRDEVVRAWKLQKAGERALKHAEDLAKQAQEAKKPLTDYFADNKSVTVVRTDPFSRYTGGEIAMLGDGRRQQQPFRLAEPEGVTAAGPDFLDKAFSLKQDEVGAVLNHDHSIAYVVRIAEHLQSTDELRNAYLTEVGIWPGNNLMISDHARITSSLLANDIRTSRALKWERNPDQRPQEQEEDQ